jgi:hypothetical protein
MTDLSESRGESDGDGNDPEQLAVEARATRMGWRKEDEWSGPPEEYRDAQAFIDVGEKELPVMRERNRNLVSRLEAAESSAKEVKATLEEFSRHHEKVDERAYNRAYSDIEGKQRAAVQEGDVSAYDALQTEKEELEKDAPQAAPAVAPVSVQNPEEEPDFVAWKADNPWYETDMDLTVFAEQVAKIVARKNPQLSGRAFFDKLTEEVRRSKPDSFKNPRRKQAATVEGAGGSTYRGSGGKDYADLPPDSKAACDKFVREKLITQKQYLAEYEWE